MISRKLNTDMRTAMRNKADEFYTMKEDIEKEIIHYKSYLKGKTVYCCCDSQESNFTVFFKEHFNDYHIKMLITSSLYENIMTVYQYDGSENKIIFSEEVEDIHDFESIKKYISISDVIITNPPFSKFRNFFNILIESGKKFLIIGNMNQILTKDIFKYVVSGDVFWGV